MKTKMKKLLFAVAIQCCYFWGTAQSGITANEAKAITANVMADFTKSVSFAYEKCTSLNEFKSKLYGKARPTDAGDGMVDAAYLYLSGEKSREDILKEDNGVAVARAFKYLYDQHKQGNVIAEGSELFGGRDDLENNPEARAADCKWYQFWCLVENFANWVVQNWPIIQQILDYITGGLSMII